MRLLPALDRKKPLTIDTGSPGGFQGTTPSLSPGAGLPVSSPLVRSRPCGAGLLPATSRAGPWPASCSGEAGVAPRDAERHGHARASAPLGRVGQEGSQVARDGRMRPAEKAV